MIRRLHIQGWRAFDEVSLDLTDGLTFVVAENGVGMTSLVQAAAHTDDARGGGHLVAAVHQVPSTWTVRPPTMVLCARP